MPEAELDPSIPVFVNKMIGLTERMLGSHKAANILIIILILLTLIPAFGIGILTMRAITPVDTTQSSN